MPSKDFSFIQDPAVYHVLPATSVAPPFLNAPGVPTVSSPIDSLLAAGHYRLAAIAAARNIVQAASPADYESLFHLLHVRLACLCLISEHALAAQEAKVLGDLNSAFYLHPLTNTHLVPWDLRVLVVRLTALGYGEWRKGIMGYYELAKECRDSIVKAGSDEDKALWKSRLRDCGIRVANILVEMDDLEGASRHLDSFTTPEQAAESTEARDVFYMEALVRLRIGDISAAHRCLQAASVHADETLIADVLKALLQLADSEYTTAVQSFQALHAKYPDDAMITQNLAVCLLYTAHIAEAQSMLSELAKTSPPFHSLVFNLSTIYELCSERNRDRKVALAESLAARKPDGVVGWEISSAGFKL
jgi:tetratricopeptide (TPR) repeat protein